MLSSEQAVGACFAALMVRPAGGVSSHLRRPLGTATMLISTAMDGSSDDDGGEDDLTFEAV
jgi:hypothetical protein